VPKGYRKNRTVRSKLDAPDYIWITPNRYAARSVHSAINGADLILSDLTSVARSRSNGTQPMWRKGTPSSNPGRSSPDQRPTQFPPYQRRTGGTARNRGGGHGRGWPTRQSEPELPSIAPLHNVRMNTKPSGRYSSRIIHDEVLPSAISRITTAV
jgi:hypothetical protein